SEESMQIKELPKEIRKIARNPEKDYGSTLESVSGKELAKSLKKILKSTDRKDTKIWVTGSIIFNELFTRKYFKWHSNYITELRDKLKKKSKLCLVDLDYGLETGGITNHRGTIEHPYPGYSSGKKATNKYLKDKTRAM